MDKIGVFHVNQTSMCLDPHHSDLLALICDVWLCFCHFPMWYPGSGVVHDCIDS